MKKKYGFTLAEVLITLGIIGVVSALTAPSLMSSFQKSKVGPSLKKFMNTIETANQHIMADNDSDCLSSVLGGRDVPYAGDIYLKELQKYVKGYYEYKLDTNIKTPICYRSSQNTLTYEVPTVSYGVLNFNDGTSLGVTNQGTTRTYNAGSTFQGAIGNLFYYDINGFQNEPNMVGKDIFAFIIDDSGAVLPYGGKIAYELFGHTYPHWSGSTNACSSTSVKDGLTCAGSVIDNDGKVVYKY